MTGQTTQSSNISKEGDHQDQYRNMPSLSQIAHPAPSGRTAQQEHTSGAADTKDSSSEERILGKRKLEDDVKMTQQRRKGQLE